MRAALPPPADDAPPDIEGRVARLRKACAVAARRDASARAATLRALRHAVLRHRPRLLEAVAHDLGRPPAETDLLELQPLLLEIGHAIRSLHRWMAGHRAPTPWVLAGTRARVEYEPRGLVLVMAPWNYPINLALAPLVGAVAAGNTVVVKPSEKAPHTAAAVAAVIADAFDTTHVATVQGGPATAEALLDVPFDHILFTGGEAKGRAVLQAAARHLTTTTLELGGKSPAIVLADADVRRAADRIVWGRFINAGQTCLAPDYVLVDTALADRFLAHATGSVARMYPDAGSRPPADLARIVDAGAWTRLTAALDQALAGGARIVTGGRRWPDERRLAPTILMDLPPDCLLLREEIFGPVLPVVAVESLTEAIAAARARPAPLAVYVFTRRRASFARAHREIPAGASVWNDVALQFANPHLPFGGGHGVYHGWHGFRTFSRERAVLRQGRFSLGRLFAPPYTRAMVRRLAWLQRFTSR